MLSTRSLDTLSFVFDGAIHAHFLDKSYDRMCFGMANDTRHILWGQSGEYVEFKLQ